MESLEDKIAPASVLTLPGENDNSRPQPIKVLLVGGPMARQFVDCPAEATHISYWVYKEPSLKAPTAEEFGNDKTMKVIYQIHPLIGNTETWHIGRLLGLPFDDAMNLLMDAYHTGANK